MIRLRSLPDQARDALALVGGFFFQAEDGIRDSSVTGVQTCLLPIYPAQFSDLCMRHGENKYSWPACLALDYITLLFTMGIGKRIPSAFDIETGGRL